MSAPSGRDENDEIPGLAKVWNLLNVNRELKFAKKLLERTFASEIRIIEELIEKQTWLVGVYTHELLIKDGLSEVYQENPVLDNAMGSNT